MTNKRSRISHIYAGNPLDRGERERRDEKWIADRARDPCSKFLPLNDLNVLISVGGEQCLGWVGIDQLTGLRIDASAVFLGLMDRQAYFVIDISGDDAAVRGLQEGGKWRFEDARTATQYLSGPESGIVAQARAQVNWHNRHGFCSVCGHSTFVKRGGQVRQCPNCDSEHFPRTDPVVITLASDQDRCLLGQSQGRMYGLKMYSALAGFMDQGESIEEAVTRELMEEAGIEVDNIRYHSSQPWPFPSSLMIGCHADAVTTEICMDEGEMADVRWFHRNEVLSALEGKNENLQVPGPIAIAHHLIKAWAAGSPG